MPHDPLCAGAPSDNRKADSKECFLLHQVQLHLPFIYLSLGYSNFEFLETSTLRCLINAKEQ